MNKTVAALLAVIVLLIAALAFMIGREQRSPITLPALETASKREQVAPPTLPEPSAQADVVRNQSVENVPQPSAGIWGKDNAVSGTCNVNLAGQAIMTGACSGSSRPTDIVLTALDSGCTVELNKTREGASAKIYEYRNTCWIDEDKEVNLEEEVSLGKLKFVNRCWIGSGVKLCFN